MADIETLTGGRIPAWWSELWGRYSAGTSHAYALSGAINDYVGFGYSSELRGFLARSLSARFDIVTFYDVAKGVRFADEIVELDRPAGAKTMRALFGIATGLSDAPQGPAGANPAMLAALKQATGQSSGKLDDLGTAPSDVLPQLDKLMRRNKKIAVIIDYADSVCPNGDKSTRPMPERTTLVTLEGWGHDPALIRNANLLILIAASAADIHSDIRAASARYHWIEIPLPNEDDRLAYLEKMLPKRPELKLEPGFTVRNLAAATSGLMRSAIEDILLLALSTPDQTITRAMVRDRKTEIIRSEYGDAIAFLETNGDLDTLGGIDLITKYLRDRVVQPMVSGDRDEAPIGLLFCGPPGTGKSAAAAALAFESGLNCIQLRPDKLLNSLLGQSEKNLEKILTCVRSLSPALLWIDELDQKASRGNTDTGSGSQTASNIFGRLLEFIAQPANRGRVIFVAATNYPERLDQALIRAGRIEIKIPFLPPDSDGRESIFRAILRNQKMSIDVDPAWITATEGWTGAEIDRLIRKARISAKPEPCSAASIATALQMTRRGNQNYQSYVDAAVAATEDIELLPLAYQQQLEAQTALQTATTSLDADDDWRPGRRLA